MKYYSIRHLKKKINGIRPYYIMAMGKRSDGKSYSTKEIVLEEYEASIKGELEDYNEDIKRFVIIRRLGTQIAPRYGRKIFVRMGAVIKRIFGDTATITYERGAFILYRDGDNLPPEEIGYMYALSTWEEVKGTDVPPGTNNIIFEEFLTSKRYLFEETTIFFNMLSTLIRDSGNATVYLLGNTISRNCPYFRLFGFDVAKLRPGKIYQSRAYTENNQECLCVLEYIAGDNDRDSDVMFAFGGERAKMITDGRWETGVYKTDIHGKNPEYYINNYNGKITIINDMTYYLYIPKSSKFPLYITDKNYQHKRNIYTIDFINVGGITKLRMITAFDRELLRKISINHIVYKDNTAGEYFNNIILTKSY